MFLYSLLPVWAARISGVLCILSFTLVVMIASDTVRYFGYHSIKGRLRYLASSQRLSGESMDIVPGTKKKDADDASILAPQIPSMSRCAALRVGEGVATATDESPKGWAG